jgi:hypothetical protein
MKPLQLSPRTLVAPNRLGQAVARSSTNVGTFAELCRALVAGGRWWMVPMILVLGLTSVLLIVVTAIEYVAPFVYTIF